MITAAALAAEIGARLIGPDRPLSRVAALNAADATCLCALFEPRFRSAARQTAAGALLTAPAFVDDCPRDASLLVSDDPRAAWGKALRRLHPTPSIAPPPPGVHPSAVVDPSAVLHATVSIGPFVYVGGHARLDPNVVLFQGARVGAGAHIGAGACVHSHAVVHDGCVVGAGCWIGAGAVIGSPGFGIDSMGRVPHIGGVRIGPRVTIGAQTCVDRGTVADTIIEADAHLDNLVQVGHNAIIGRGAVLCGQVGLAGGARVDAGAVIGGQAGVAGRATVGAGAHVAAQAGVTKDLAPGGRYSGHPAEENHARLKRMARLRKALKEQENS